MGWPIARWIRLWSICLLRVTPILLNYCDWHEHDVAILPAKPTENILPDLRNVSILPAAPTEACYCSFEPIFITSNPSLNLLTPHSKGILVEKQSGWNEWFSSPNSVLHTGAYTLSTLIFLVAEALLRRSEILRWSVKSVRIQWQRIALTVRRYVECHLGNRVGCHRGSRDGRYLRSKDGRHLRSRDGRHLRSRDGRHLRSSDGYHSRNREVPFD